VLAVSATSASAQQIIYTDSLVGTYVHTYNFFDDGIAKQFVGGSAPEVIGADADALGGSSSATWQALNQYGNQSYQRTTLGAEANNRGENAYLPFSPITGNVYTLTVDVTPVDTSSEYGIGFASTFYNGGESGFNNGNYGPSGQVVLGDAASLNSQSFASGVAANNTVEQTVTITLDTTGALWTESALLGGTGDTLSFTYPPEILPEESVVPVRIT
jgi:hypothetical protein